jgi:S1-C subfamily serine protease
VSVTDIGNGRTYSARVVGYDRSGDIAVLQLSGASGLRVASIDDTSKAALGEAVVAIGNAGGVGGKPSVAGGSVTGLGKSITATEEDGANPEQLKGLIEVNADIQAGDSGGSLVNSAGQVLGVDTAASTGFSFSTASSQGYAIPIGTATALAQQIEAANGSTTVHIGATAFLGVSLSATATSSGSTQSGAALAGVVSGSPASSAGLAAGDVITSLGGNPVTSATELTALMVRYHPGDHLKVGWIDTSGQHHTASLQLATGPAA